MSEHTYKCKSAKAVATRIWNADFYLGSFSELVESEDPDSAIATVGLSEVSGPEKKLSMVATINNHPWGPEIVELLLDNLMNWEPPILEWSVSYKYLSWTFTMTWRD